ncbi:arginase family protein [Novilysobacter arseniciresistens]|uniref:arginase family protein n=1 Tax=Novilysobacter arseniciresistens TaxID=1385522 RepID=UPI001EF03147|nr:arginase family protein [Lysobacter arseniciresistens]
MDAKIAQLLQWLEPAQVIYLTICLDVLPPSTAPGVSAPSARGVAIEVAEALLTGVVGTGRVKLCDVAELSPAFDRDGTTARVAARLLHQVTSCHPMAIEGCVSVPVDRHAFSKHL